MKNRWWNFIVDFVMQLFEEQLGWVYIDICCKQMFRGESQGALKGEFKGFRCAELEYEKRFGSRS
jgi:hypothetical protein